MMLPDPYREERIAAGHEPPPDVMRVWKFMRGHTVTEEIPELLVYLTASVGRDLLSPGVMIVDCLRAGKPTLTVYVATDPSRRVVIAGTEDDFSKGNVWHLIKEVKDKDQCRITITISSSSSGTEPKSSY